MGLAQAAAVFEAVRQPAGDVAGSGGHVGGYAGG